MKKAPQTSAVLLSIGVRLVQSDATSVIYWRPRLLKSYYHVPGEESTCRCGLFAGESFLRPFDEMGPSQEGEQVSEVASNTLLSESRQEALSVLPDLLTRRCLREIAPSSADTEMTKASVKQGYKPASSKGGFRNLPKYDIILLSQVSCLPSTTMTARAVPKKPFAHDAVRERLSYCGFLPSWSGSALDAGDKKRSCETVMPLPQLSVELVQI